MPGSSLWLLPPSDHPLNSTLSSLISQTADHFSSPHLFLPHITLTSNIHASTYSEDPQKWLDSISFPAGVEVRLGSLASEDIFVRKLYSTVVKNDGLRDTGAVARRYVDGFEGEGEARMWAEEVWMPHLSLLYHDCPKVSRAEIEKVTKYVEDSGAKLSGDGEASGWKGGRVVLVPTDRPINEWKPIAEKAL